MPALPSWLVEPLWAQFEALLPKRPMYDPAHPLGSHRRRISDHKGDAFFDLADTIITVRSLIRRAWTTHRWDSRPERRR